jgi:tetratricopeptide (TPR) repeat protein
MNLDFVEHTLLQDGWKKDRWDGYAGLRIDLAAARRFRFEPWRVLVKAVPVLDLFVVKRLQNEIELFWRRSAYSGWHRNLSLYLVTGKVTQQALHFFQTDALDLKRFNQLKNGTRKIWIFDEMNRQMVGPFPPAEEAEKKAPFDLSPIFMRALTPDGAAYPQPPVHESVERLIEILQPAAALRLIEESGRTDLGVYRVDALRELGRGREADAALDELLPRLEGDELARARRFKAQYHFGKGEIDEGIWLLEAASRSTRDACLRAAILATKATGYAVKRCFNLAEDAIRAALQVAPDEPRVLFAQAGLFLLMDQRLEARHWLEHMDGEKYGWVNSYIDLELAEIALLLGEFDEAARLANSALAYSVEIINPLVTLTSLAHLKGDLTELERLVFEIERRSPQADLLPSMKAGVEWVRKQKLMLPNGLQHRLKAFPSLVQRRDYCGPCTIELVLRYWKGGLDLTNRDIAQRVKLPQSGSTIHSMTEFFHLVGFDTLRCIAPVEILKKLVKAGFPVIVEEQMAGSSHVTVVIGYDDEAGTVELQDPMTHHVLPVPVEILNHLRRNSFNSALVAYPRSQEHAALLRRMGLFLEAALALVDQAGEAGAFGDHVRVAALMERATQLRPRHAQAWSFWLNALLEQWREAYDYSRAQLSGQEAEVKAVPTPDLEKIRSQFKEVLERARLLLPQAAFIFLIDGEAAQLEGDLPHALDAYQKALELDPGNPYCLVRMAACQYGLRQVEKALESSRQAVKSDPGSVEGNVWMARCLAFLGQEHAEYYARVGLELAPTWWMAHLALAEALLHGSQPKAAQEDLGVAVPSDPRQTAWQEIGQVLINLPDQPDALAQRAYLWINSGNFINAQADLEKALKAALREDQKLDPITIYQVYQGLCRSSFSQERYNEALMQVHALLERDPADPWALQFRSDAEFQKMIQDSPVSGENASENAGESAGDPSGPEAVNVQTVEFAAALERYLAAIKANAGDPDVVGEFLGCLVRLGYQNKAIQISEDLRVQYPGQPNLDYVHGWLLSVVGLPKRAADAMLLALRKENGIRNRHQLDFAVETIIQGFGSERGEKDIMHTALPKSLTVCERDRALGLALSDDSKANGARARQLLEAVLAIHPDDAEVLLAIGRKAPIDEAEREDLYHQAVILAPRWTFARMLLANYLANQGRCEEALEFTTGHEYESFDILTQHVYALHHTGQYEEAALAAERLVCDKRLPGERVSYHYHWKWDIDSYCGEYSKALEIARQAQQRFPKELDWIQLESRSLCDLGQIVEAEAALTAGKKKGMQEDLVKTGKYWIALAQGELKTALGLAKKEAGGDYWTALEKGDLKNAVELGGQQEAARLVSNIPELGLWRSRYMVLLAHFGNEKEAKSYLTRYVHESQVLAELAFVMSSTHANRLTLFCAEKALKDEKISALSKFYAEFARSIARRNQENPKAHQYFEAVRKQYPLQPGAYEQLALYAALDKDLDHASSLAEQAVILGRMIYSTWAVRGLINFLKGERETALNDLKSAWNRARFDRYIKGFLFWWLYKALAGDPAAAAEWELKATAQAESTFDQKLLELIKVKLEEAEISS